MRFLLGLITSLVIFMICLGLYWQGLHGPFLLDDLQSIQVAQIDEFSWRELLNISLQNGSGPLGRPLTIATFILNNYFFGLNPFSYKVVNLILHCLTFLAATFFIYLLVILQPRHRRYAVPIAVMTGVLWLFHPLLLSTVLYPVQRMTQLSHLFTLIALNTYLWGRIRLNTHQPHALSLLSLSIFLFFPLALSSKETGVLFVWYLYCIEYFLLKFHTANPHQEVILRRFHSLFSLSLILSALIYYWYNLPKFLMNYAAKGFTIYDRLLTEIKVVAFYLKLIVLPQISEMGLYHDDFPLSTSLDGGVLSAGSILLLCVILIFTLRRRAPVVAFGLSWFFISQAIESTVLPLELVFEHRNYLASLGILFIPSYYFVTHFNKLSQRYKGLSLLFITLILALFMMLTYARSQAWSSTVNFLKEENFYHPLSARVHIENANWLLERNDYDNAFAELDYAQKLEPNNLGIPLHKILIYCRGQTVPPLLYQTTLRKMKSEAITPYVIMVLDGLIYNIFNGKCAAVDKNTVIQIVQNAYWNPFLTYRPLYLAVLYHLEAGLQLLNKDIDQSRLLLLKSFDVYPQRFDPLIQKAYIELQHGRFDQAQETRVLIQQHADSIYAPTLQIAKLDNVIASLKAKQLQHEKN